MIYILQYQIFSPKDIDTEQLRNVSIEILTTRISEFKISTTNEINLQYKLKEGIVTAVSLLSLPQKGVHEFFPIKFPISAHES